MEVASHLAERLGWSLRSSETGSLAVGSQAADQASSGSIVLSTGDSTGSAGPVEVLTGQSGSSIGSDILLHAGSTMANAHGGFVTAVAGAGGALLSARLCYSQPKQRPRSTSAIDPLASGAGKMSKR